MSLLSTITQARRRVIETLIAAGYEKEEAHSTARILLDHITSLAHAHLIYPEKSLESQAQAELEKALQQLADGTPLPYVIGTQHFYGRTFSCDRRALIPRPETELLIEKTISILEQDGMKVPRIADLGTGTGCIAITLALELPRAEVYATDISADALALAQENASRHNVEKRVRFVPGKLHDWSTPLRDGAPFDVIVSNPPYIATSDIARLQVQVRRNEPMTALDGGEDGLDEYRRLASQCRDVLKPGGTLLCELGAGQWAEVRDIFSAASWNVGDAIIDFQDIARVLVARRI